MKPHIPILAALLFATPAMAWMTKDPTDPVPGDRWVQTIHGQSVECRVVAPETEPAGF